MRESIKIEIYSRPGCHLCDDAKAAIEPFTRRYSIDLIVTDVDSDDALRQAYGSEIPVVMITKSEEENIMVRDWNRRADKEKLLAQFQSWKFDWLDVPSMINNKHSARRAKFHKPILP